MPPGTPRGGRGETSVAVVCPTPKSALAGRERLAHMSWIKGLRIFLPGGDAGVMGARWGR